MDKKEARKILGVGKEISRNDIERKYSILLKKQRMKEYPAEEDEQDDDAARDNAALPKEEAEGYSFDQITDAYNILMGYEVKVKEEPPSKAAPLLQKAGIDEKKARNFFYYYKFHMLGAIVAIIVIVLTVRGCVMRQNPDFTTAFIGEFSYSTATDKLSELIKTNVPEIKVPGFDGAFISNNDKSDQQYAMVTKATVLFAAGDVDLFICDKENFKKYAKNGAFLSLDEVAPKLGIDLEKNKENIVKLDYSDDESGGKAGQKNEKKPAEQHLYGVDISQSKALKQAGVVGKDFIAAIRTHGKHIDAAEKLLKYLMK